MMYYIGTIITLIVLWLLTVKKYGNKDWFYYTEKTICILIPLSVMLGGYVMYFWKVYFEKMFF